MIKISWLDSELSGRSVREWRQEIKSKLKSMESEIDFRSKVYCGITITLTIILISGLMHVANGRLYWALPILYFAIGLVYYQYQFILHEASHWVLFTNRRLNEFVGNAAGIIAGYNLIVYRSNHNLHHKFLGTEKDPENGNFTSGKKGFIQLLLRSIVGLDALKLVTANSTTRGGSKLTLIYSMLLYLSIGVIFSDDVIAFILYSVLLVLSVASFTFFLNRFRGLSEHPLGLELKDCILSRTHTERNIWTYLFAPFNFNYHVEHHLLPEISSIYYPYAHQFLSEKIGRSPCFKKSFF